MRPEVVDVVDEEAGHRVREQQPALADEVAPCPADELRRRGAARREPAQDALDHVVR